MTHDAPKTALAYGFLGSNLGDVAITKGALALLRSAGVEGAIPVVSRAPNTKLTRSSWARVAKSEPEAVISAWDHTFPSLRSDTPPNLTLIRALLESPAVTEQILKAAGVAGVERLFYSGGENLFSYGTANDDWNLFGRLSVFIAARKHGIRTAFLPCTFGPFETKTSRYLIERAVKGADFVLARDARSLAHLPKSANARNGADCAFFTGDAASSDHPPKRWGRRIAMVPRLEGAGLRLGPQTSAAYLDSLKEQGVERSEAFDIYYRIGRLLLEKGRYIRILTQCDADVALNHALCKALSEIASQPNQVTLSRPTNLMAYHRALHICGGVVTSRLHTAIFALQNGIVPLTLYFDAHGHKTPGLFSLLGLDDFCVPARQFDASTILDRMAQARAEAADAGERLAALKADTIATVRDVRQPPSRLGVRAVR